MPLMIMDNRKRPVRVATTVGHTFVFQPDKPMLIPEHCVSRCLQAGARFVDDADNALLEEPEREKLSINRQMELMVELLREMYAKHRDYAEHFGSNNLPKATFVNEHLSSKHGSRFQFAAPEVARAWRQVRDEARARQSGTTTAEEA